MNYLKLWKWQKISLVLFVDGDCFYLSMAMRNLMTCVGKMILLLRFHVNGTFYLTKSSNRWSLIKAVLKSATKTKNATVAFGWLLITLLLESTAVTFLINSNFRRNGHPLELYFKWNDPCWCKLRLKPEHVAEASNHWPIKHINEWC